MFIEYPKALYKDGIGSSLEELPHVVVNNREQEEEKNADGWFEIGKAPVSDAPPSEDRGNRKPGRPRKTEAE